MALVQKELKNAYIGEFNPFDDYQEVAYIQSSGTQYFSVLNSFKTSYKIVIDFQMVTTGGDYIPLGMIEPGTYYKYGIDAYGGYFKVTSGGSNWANTKSEDKNRHTFIINKSTATVDGTNYSINYVDYTYNFGIGVFAYRTNKWEYASSNKLYKLDIYDENGTQIFNGVPCYRKSDSVIGMYDVINKVFYTNQGSGTFTKGPDIGSWTPDASRTLLYLKLENNVTDSSGNSVSVSSSGITYGTAGDKYYAQLTSTTGYIRPAATLAQQIGTGDFTVSFFLYPVTHTRAELAWRFGDWYDSGSPRPGICIRYGREGNIAWLDDGNGTNQFSIACSQNTWHYQAYVRKSGVSYCYLDGVYVGQHNNTINLANPGVNKFYILNRSDYSGQRWGNTGARISEVIFENVAWSANDVQNYYNSIKNNYTSDSGGGAGSSAIK